MSNEATLSQTLSLLSDLIGSPPLAFDDNGMCILGHQDGFAVILMTAPDSDILLLSAQLTEIPTTGREALFGWLLRMNYLGLETGGASLCLDAEETHVHLCHNIALGRVEGPALVTMIGNFIEVAAGLRVRLMQDEAPLPVGSGESDGHQPGSNGVIFG
jgi:hypothetical protein